MSILSSHQNSYTNPLFPFLDKIEDFAINNMEVSVCINVPHDNHESHTHDSFMKDTKDVIYFTKNMVKNSPCPFIHI